MVSSARSARVRESAGNLPVDVTSFVGRRHEITRTKRLLAESRLVTLTGQGGVGKTRLALRVASSMRRIFRDKAWCVNLEELRDGTLLAEAAVEQLSLGGPSSGTDVDAVVEHLRHREMLLVLDNCEHVIEDAALFVDSVLRWCPGVRILATSRQSLGVAGEATLVVPPMQIPDLNEPPPPESYEQFSSVRLFLDRARSTVPDFEVTAEDGAVLMRLCARLDGNPLAIELAALRLRSLSLHQLEERLVERFALLSEGRRGSPTRQQSLRALIDWSYELCSEQDRIAWARVSVFAGSFGLAAAEHVASDGLSRVDVLGAMHSLVDQSILVREEEAGEVRFRLLHALRDYGQERLEAAGEPQRVLARHRDWYAEVAERFAADWLGPHQPAWVRELRLDLDNLRLALDTAVHERATAPGGLRLAARLTPFWSLRGLNGEARHWLELALAHVPPDTPERPAGLRANAWFALVQGDTAAAAPLLDEAEALATEHDDEFEVAYVTQIRGMAAFFRDDLAAAEELLADALGRFHDLEAARGEWFGLFALGLVKGLRGDRDGGIALLRECIEAATGRGELLWRSAALWASAHIEILRGASARAETAAKEALRLQRSLDNRLASAFTIDILAWIAHGLGRDERAARLFGAASAVWDAVRAAPEFYGRFRTTHDEYEHGARRALGDRAYREAFDRGYEMSPDAAVDYALELKRTTRSVAPDELTATTLTKREREIAELVAQGRTNKEIAETLVIAQRTVEGHVQHILTKLDFSSRAQIAGWLAGRRAY
ncbi:LuxR C-terminal-related transcriptional regulator [Saccharopolyspora gloriosae]|uniref:ATP-binding protein n=1 Tax=Saccharopolyspora gloriosae TaxID=455344 RepID=UPI001FB8515B|nr:LuxR C-terminal-related transcriptional regulator [Saccharopolyspora gloriosae]